MADADPQKTFNVHEAKTQFSRLLERAHAGEEILLAKGGVLWAKMVPVEAVPKRRRQPGGLTVTGPIPDSAFFDSLSDAELDYIDDRPVGKRR